MISNGTHASSAHRYICPYYRWPLKLFMLLKCYSAVLLIPVEVVPKCPLILPHMETRGKCKYVCMYGHKVLS